MIYDHHKGALKSNQQKMHDTAYCIVTIIVNKGTKKQNKKGKKQTKTEKVCKKNVKRNNYV